MTARTTLILLIMGLGIATELQGQGAPLQLPFVVGETLTYRARIGGIATGTGEMRVEGPEAVRGRDTYVLSFDFRGGAGPVRMSGETRSWLDPETMNAMRFHKLERSPLSRSEESVEMYPAQGIWRAADGSGGNMPSRLPLDELSFLYYVRTLALPTGARYTVERHFEQGRNPVQITVTGREEIEVPAGRFPVVVVEMRVPNDDHVSDGGLIRLFLTDDAWRIPVRIETSVRIVGRVVLQLEASNRHQRVAKTP
jgi:hypothetical protein